MLLLNTERRSLLDAALRTICLTGAALDTVVSDTEALHFGFCAAHGVVATVDGAGAEVEILYLRIADDEDDADVAGVARIDILSIRLFCENHVLPVLLLLVGHWHGYSREAYHLLILG